METDILTNGSMVKNHIPFERVLEAIVIRRTSFRSCFHTCKQVFPTVLTLQHHWHLQDTDTGEMSLLVTSSLSRTWISPTVGEDEEDNEEWLSCFIGVLEVDEDPEEELDKSGATIGTKFSVSQIDRMSSLMRYCFWPLTHSKEYLFSSQSFQSHNTAGVLSTTLIVKNISNSLTYTVASSGICTSPLAVMTIVGLHDFVKVSISASLKSFLLIMCIDAPESTTNSLSLGFNVDAGRHLFSGDEKNAALSCSFNLKTFLASFHAASRAPNSCHSVSSREGSSNFGALGLRWWGSPGQKYLSEGFWSRILIWRAIAFFYKLDRFRHVSALPKNRLRRRHVLKYATQLSCIR